MGWLIGHLYPQDEASWFILGSGGHKAIEMAIVYGLSVSDAIDEGMYYADREIKNANAAGREILTAYRSLRTVDTMRADMTQTVKSWFKDVHPDSPDRMPRYDEYTWPPKVEHIILLPDVGSHGLRTQVDAIFVDGPEREEVAIVDWKTGSSSSAPRAQLDIYHYGGKLEGWMPPEQKFTGWFHHTTKGKLQVIERYIGDAVVASWIRAADLRKAEIAKAEYLPVADNSFRCAKTNTANKNCPVCGPEDTRPEITEVLGRILQAKEIQIGD